MAGGSGGGGGLQSHDLSSICKWSFLKTFHRTYVLVSPISADIQLKTFGMSNVSHTLDKTIGLTGVSSSSSWVCTWKPMDRLFQNISFCLYLTTILGNKMP